PNDRFDLSVVSYTPGRVRPLVQPQVHRSAFRRGPGFLGDPDSSVILGLILALGSALGTNLGFLLKQRGAVLARPIRLRHPARSAVDLFRSRWFLVGWIVSLVAWVLHVAALSLAALSSVQGGLVGRARLPGGVGRAIF